MTENRSEQPRIVVGVDGSEQSEQALRWAAHLASIFGARLEAVAAWDYPTGYGFAAAPVEWNPAEDMQKLVEQTVHAVFGDAPPIPVTITVNEGGAARLLIEAAEGATMLVVGSRGHGGFAGLLLGSVSASVAEHASCPVLVVHGDGQPPRAVPAVG